MWNIKCVALRADKDMDWDQDTIELTWDHRSGFPNVSQASVTYVLTLKMCYLERRYIKCEVCHHLMEIGFEDLSVLSVPHVLFQQETTTTSRQVLSQENQGESL
jgi:hypothetical protein